MSVYSGSGELDQSAVIAVVTIPGLLGGFLGHRLRIPSGAFAGAMVGVGTALGFLGFPKVSVPPVAGQSLQVMVGVIVGLRITGESLRSGARSLVPAMLVAAIFLASGLAAATAAVSLTGLSPTTALFAAAPGGLTEMASVGASLGADGPAIAAIHLSRLLLVLLAANLILARIGRTRLPEQGDAPTSPNPTSREGFLKLGAIAAAGLAGGIVGLALTPLPAGGVVGALAGAGVVRAVTAGPVPEQWFSSAVQVLSGVIIGLGLSAQFFEALSQLAGAAVLVNLTQMVVWILAGYLLVWLFRFDPRTGTFASAPGGMGILLSIIGETDADLVTVAFTHLLRLSTTIVVVPVVAAALF
ncbi:MAG TPA: AbrB family transcriptional regulator [Rubrobacter sp.]|nr:AbrB family transcriptional regulator [Rubrobacter sp.]